MCGLYWEYPWFCIVTAVYIPVLSGSVLLFTSISIGREVIKLHRLDTRRVHPAELSTAANRHNGSQTQTISVDIEESNDRERLQIDEFKGGISSTSVNESHMQSRKQVHSTGIGGQTAKEPKKVQNRDLKAVKVLVVTAAVYFTAWGPYVVLVVLISFFPSITVPPELRFTFTWMANSNSFMNVFIYSVMYSGFRRNAVVLFRNSFAIVLRCCGIQLEMTKIEDINTSDLSAAETVRKSNNT